MGQKSAWLEQKVSQALLGKTDSIPTVPDTWYVALSTQPFDSLATGAAMNEVTSGVGYARIALTNDGTTFPAPAAPTSSGSPVVQTNQVEIDWPTPTGDWGNLQSFYFCDAETVGTGNVWFGSDISSPFDVTTGGGAQAPVGGITINEY